MAKETLGHIDCPTCGTHEMRVTADKNGDPFGYCENCGQQLRVGPDRRRVREFVKRHGFGTVTVTVQAEPDVQPAAEPKQKQIPTTEAHQGEAGSPAPAAQKTRPAAQAKPVPKAKQEKPAKAAWLTPILGVSHG